MVQTGSSPYRGHVDRPEDTCTPNGFPSFAKLVAETFQDMTRSGSGVFVVDVDGDALYALYLASFPEGTDPVFKKKTEHDCSCCRHFIRRAGAVVTIEGDELRTVWDRAAESAPSPYRVVATALRDAVRAANVSDLFRVNDKEMSFGTERSRSLDAETGRALTWQHFYTGEIPKSLRHAMPDTVRGDYRTTVQVFKRGLTELSPEAVETTLSLTAPGGIYRGEEHRVAVEAFQRAQREYLSKSSVREGDLYAWRNAAGTASRFRNTVIGTLVQDLSEGKSIEHAVQAFETKVAPQNYKRTTALITPGMVKKAMETIEKLGLEPALERRFAVFSDISVRDVKWVNGAVKPLMKGGIGDVLMKHAEASTRVADPERAEEITLDDLVSHVLPETTSMELLFKSEHVGNLVSLTAPVHPESKQLFRWTNDFSWSYTGNVADSIRERVKKAGGKVDGAALRISLSWWNFDDLDLHVHEPAGRGVSAVGGHIFFQNKVGRTGGQLDVDMNAGRGTTRQAVENVVWMRTPLDGVYVVLVHNYCQRETADPGFVIEVESGGKLSHYSYNKAVRNFTYVDSIAVHVKGGVVECIETRDSGITAQNVSQEKWGLRTETYVPVSVVTLSPNYWGDSAVGNKHTIFILEGAKNDEATRGFYNEQLHPRLESHHKVFEVIGDKTKCASTEGQLSGLGFSSTKKDSFIVRVHQGKKQRLLHVRVGA